MAVQNYWESDYENNAYVPDSGGSPVGDPYDMGQTVAPQAASGPPYTVNNPPPPSDDPTKEWVLNPTTGQFELRPRNQTPPATTGGFNDPNNRPPNPPAGYTYEWDAGSNRWYLKPTSANTPPPDYGQQAPPPITSVPGADGETATAFDWPGWESAGPFTPRDNTFETRPAPVADPFSYEAAPAYENFSYDPYTASSWEDAEKEPGYGASRAQLRKQIEAGAAHRGMLRSGMTIGDLYTGLDSLGQQNFQNFDNRRFRNYSANRDNAFTAHQANASNKFQTWQGSRNNAFDAWRANADERFRGWQGDLGADAQKFALELGADRDVYDRRAADIDKGNNYRYNVASSQFQDMLSRWQERVRSLTNIATAGANS